MDNIFRPIMGENKFDLFIPPMFHDPLDNQKFICLKIEEIWICPPKRGTYDVFDRIANHNNILLKRQR